MSAKLKAPQHSGEHLAVPDFHEVPHFTDSNHRRLDSSPVLLHGIPLSELRRQAREELGLPAGPVIVTGHQPEFFHPGVWVKNFAACGLARQLGGTAINLIVDSDTVKSTAIRLPTWPENNPTAVTLSALAYDEAVGELPYELRKLANPDLLASFGRRLAGATASWPFEPIGSSLPPLPLREGSGKLAESISHLRRATERALGCDTVDLTVSRLSRFQSFQRFIRHIAAGGERFRDSYNASLAAYRKVHRVRSRNHPAPDLAEGELPFWRMTPTKRERAFDTTAPEQLRPRALTLTLFARLILGDYFIHGLGGGLYDQVTDEIIRNFFGIEPPAFQILTATLHLPLPRVPFEPATLRHAQRTTRDLRWNAYKFLERAEHAEHRRIIGMPRATRSQRRARSQEFRDLNLKLGLQNEHLRESTQDRILQLEALRAASSVISRRDYAWILYPEQQLKPFLQRFLEP